MYLNSKALRHVLNSKALRHVLFGCRSNAEPALEFPLPPAITLAKEPRPAPNPRRSVQRRGYVQGLCASLRAGSVPLMPQKGEPCKTEPEAVPDAPPPVAHVAMADRVPADRGPDPAPDPSTAPFIGGSSCASDAAAARAPPSGDRSDNDDPGPFSSEKRAAGQPAAADPTAGPSAPADGSTGGAGGGVCEESSADQRAAEEETAGHTLTAGAGTGADADADASADAHDVPVPAPVSVPAAAAHIAPAAISEGMLQTRLQPVGMCCPV